MTELESYQQEFVLFKNDLKSFIYRIIAHKEDTEDLAQETYIKVFKNMDSFQGKSSFKTWVFSIATNLVKDSLRAKKRWGENWQDLGKEYNQINPEVTKEKVQISQTSEHGKFVIREHINFCFTCINKTLLLPNQICLLLKNVYNFKVKEIVLITNLTEGKVKHAIADARKDMLRIFDYRCSLINQRGICHQCSELNNKFNPKQNVQIELNKIKLTKKSPSKNNEELLKLRLELVKNIDPLNVEGTSLHNYILENCPDWVEIITNMKS